MELVMLFAVFAGTAVLPVAGAEAFLVAFMAVHHAGVPWWAAGPVAAAGQLYGKAVHVLPAGRFAGVPAGLRRLVPTVARCRAHPRSAAGTVLLSAKPEPGRGAGAGRARRRGRSWAGSGAG